jgi:hypothetical protein
VRHGCDSAVSVSCICKLPSRARHLLHRLAGSIRVAKRQGLLVRERALFVLSRTAACCSMSCLRAFLMYWLVQASEQHALLASVSYAADTCLACMSQSLST